MIGLRPEFTSETLVFGEINASDIVAVLCQAGCSDTPNVTHSEYGNFHRLFEFLM